LLPSSSAISSKSAANLAATLKAATPIIQTPIGRIGITKNARENKLKAFKAPSKPLGASGHPPPAPPPPPATPPKTEPRQPSKHPHKTAPMNTARLERHPKAKKRGQPALTAAGSNRTMPRRRYVLAANKTIIQAILSMPTPSKRCLGQVWPE
jgi:hypothetical protein